MKRLLTERLAACGKPLAMAALATGAIPALAQTAPDPVWTEQFGTSAFDAAFALAPDGAGGAFVAGNTEGSLGGPNAGQADWFLARYDNAGAQVWLTQTGTTDWDQAHALAPDGAGGVYIAGDSRAALGGTSAGNYDAVFARYDSAGNQLWIRQIGTSGLDHATAIAADGAGGMYVAGRTRGDLAGPNQGGFDAFLARYNAAGDQLWIRQFGTSGLWDVANALAADGAGGVFIAGDTNGSLGGPHLGLTDAFLARYNSDGDQVWIRQFGTSSSEEAHALAPDGAGGVFVAGHTQGSLGGPAAGFHDVFLARYDADGVQQWVKQFGTNRWDEAYALSEDGSGGVYIAGQTDGSLAAALSGEYDGFMAHYDGAGDQSWILQLGTTGWDAFQALSSDGAGGAYVAGFSMGSLGGSNQGSGDAFLARFPGSSEPCYANCDGSAIEPILTVDDFTCFINEFAQAQQLSPAQQIEHYANCDGSTTEPVLTVDDFTCFINAFAQGCP